VLAFGSGDHAAQQAEAESVLSRVRGGPGACQGAPRPLLGLVRACVWCFPELVALLGTLP